MKFKQLFILLLSFFLFRISTQAQQITQLQLDSLVTKALKTFNVPGMAVSIVKDGKIICNKGYGFRSLSNNRKTDDNTLFGIASNSKAFTAAALGILVSEGKLKWTDKVTTIIPEFKLYDSYVTKEFTIIDLLTHRSGLELGAGDLLHTPDSTDFTIADIIKSLQYLKPEASFRSRFAYDNIFYLVAAEIVKRVSGISWQNFIETRIMQPLQMNNSRASYNRAKNNVNIIDGYKLVTGNPELYKRSSFESDAGAGGIYSSAADMSRWMLMQLNDGRYGADTSQQLFSRTVHAAMWTPYIFIPVGKYGAYNTHFGAYGLGWFLTDIKGFENVWHTGQDDGMNSEVSLIPDLNFGITVLTNAESSEAVNAIIDQVVDSYIGITATDRIAQWSSRVNNNNSSEDSTEEAVWKTIMQNETNKNSPADLSLYTGIYNDNWFGNVEIKKINGRLHFRSERSRQLRGNMYWYAKDTFVVRWDNPQITVDAFVNFSIRKKEKTNGFTMQRVVSGTSFGYDFQDLNFTKSEK